jgi:hypothetical protein
MKRIAILLMVIFSACITNNSTGSNSRINEELVSVISPIKSIGRVIGWNKNSFGQWISKKNVIPDDSFSGKDNFNRLRTFDILHNNKVYAVFEKVTKVEMYKYPNIRQGRYTIDRSNFFVFEKDKFIINIKKNDVVFNNIDIIFGSFDVGVVTSKKDIENYITGLFKSKVRHTNDKNFEIYTFYDTNDNAIRFFIKSGSLLSFYASNNFNEKNYFECDYKTFTDFFTVNIIE